MKTLSWLFTNLFYPTVGHSMTIWEKKNPKQDSRSHGDNNALAKSIPADHCHRECRVISETQKQMTKTGPAETNVHPLNIFIWRQQTSGGWFKANQFQFHENACPYIVVLLNTLAIAVLEWPLQATSETTRLYIYFRCHIFLIFLHWNLNLEDVCLKPWTQICFALWPLHYPHTLLFTQTYPVCHHCALWPAQPCGFACGWCQFWSYCPAASAGPSGASSYPNWSTETTRTILQHEEQGGTFYNTTRLWATLDWSLWVSNLYSKSVLHGNWEHRKSCKGSKVEWQGDTCCV